MADYVNSQVGDSHSVEDHFEHPTPFTYVKVAIALVVITAIEVGVFYLEWLGKGIIPVLAILSGMKFALVIMFYMHLRYDSKLFSVLFLGGLSLAFLVMLGLLVLFRVFI